jgi:D-amino-acid oxidase
VNIVINFLVGSTLGSRISSWEYPPAVCGHHEVTSSVGKAAKWSMISYHFFHSLARDPVKASDYGVRMRKTVFFFEDRINKDKNQQQKMSDIRCSGVIDFHHDSRGLLQEYDVPKDHYVDAYSLQAPVIDTDKALIKMLELVKKKGAEVIQDGIEINAIEDGGKKLCKQYNVDAIVNATGLGAREVAGDDKMYGLRGAVIRLQNDGKKFTKIEDALVVSAIGVKEDKNSRYIHKVDVPLSDLKHLFTATMCSFIFIVPRNNNIVVLGGFARPKEEEEEITSINDLHLEDLRNRCNRFLCNWNLELGQIDNAYPYAQGLRPGRIGDVRVEREKSVVHNYG